MVHYGMIMDNTTIMMINAAQAVVNIYYILTYVMLTRHKVSIFLCNIYITM